MHAVGIVGTFNASQISSPAPGVTITLPALKVGTLHLREKGCGITSMQLCSGGGQGALTWRWAAGARLATQKPCDAVYAVLCCAAGEHPCRPGLLRCAQRPHQPGGPHPGTAGRVQAAPGAALGEPPRVAQKERGDWERRCAKRRLHRRLRIGKWSGAGLGRGRRNSCLGTGRQLILGCKLFLVVTRSHHPHFTSLWRHSIHAAHATCSAAPCASRATHVLFFLFHFLATTLPNSCNLQ